MIRHATLLALACSAGALMTASSGVAATGKQQNVEVELVFLWKRLPVWRMKIDASINATGYSVKARSRALGVVWAFTRMTSVASAKGSINGRGIQPTRYRSDSKFRSRKSLVELTYPAGKTVTRITPKKSTTTGLPCRRRYGKAHRTR